MNRSAVPLTARVAAWLGSAILAAAALSQPAAPAELEQGFQQPPASARPWVYLMVMDGNLTREGITADFEALQRAGIGGMIVMEVNAGIPQGPVKFMSAEWQGCFKHAVAEAERLGLQLTLNAGPGWTGSGGPWVPPAQSMQHIVASAVEVQGPTHFHAALPVPPPRPAYFGNDGMPPAMLKATREFYADVAVLAFPTPPAGAAPIADIDEKALYLRHPYSSRPGTRPFLPAPAAGPAAPASTAIATERVVDLTGRLTGGRLEWDVPAGSWTILRFVRTSTGANTRPAPAPGLGLECDKFDKAALEAHFDAFVGGLLRQIGPRKPSAEAGWTMLHIDSWEMGAQNWTAAFRDEFRRRRGYDPIRYLPAVTGRLVGSAEISERFLWDLRQTAQELVLENHAEHLKTLGRRHGFTLSIEPYDMNPCADMSLGGVADVPMGEFWMYGFNTCFSVLEAASIAHTCGRPVVAAEAFTSTDAERWHAHPASMKTLGDWAFAAGVNRIVFHRCQHQPWLDRWPGMTMGPYGVHWDRTQTWWGMVPAYHAYLSRCQFLLRRGLAVADVCYLVAEGAPHVFRPPPSATRGHPPERLGYNFDGCAPQTLLARAAVQDGRIVLPDGMSYRVLVLPERQTMTPALLGKVKELVAAGATVVGPRPVQSPSLSDYPQGDEQVRRLAGELWGECDGRKIRQHAFGRGRVIWESRGEIGSDDDSHPPLERAQWIWHAEGNPAAKAPVGKRFFRRVFNLEPGAAVESAFAAMTADNSFELFVNGTSVGSGDNFHLSYAFDVTRLLKPGNNLLAVVADNGADAPNPAGLIGQLTIKFRDGRVQRVPTDRQWQSAAAVPADWASQNASGGGWGGAMELGPLGMGPWGAVGKASAEPEQYGDFAIVAGVLEQMGVAPDFESDGPVRYAHRRDADAEIYFVANREDRRVDAKCTFRVSGKSPELWDPLTGQIRDLPQFACQGGRTTVPLRFEPAQSFFVVFRKAVAQGKPAKNFPDLSAVAELAGPWNVAFDPKWGGPQHVVFQTLEDWSQRPEEGIRYYSGTATYSKTFDVVELAGRRAFLDLGRVKAMARVRLNGQDLGVVWCAPWRVEVTGRLKAKGNRLEIAVANLWPNRLIGDQGLPPQKRRTWTTWNPFRKDSPLLESGLLGPVTVVAE